MSTVKRPIRKGLVLLICIKLRPLGPVVVGPADSVQPAGTQDHRQREKNGQGGPGDAVERRFGAAGTCKRSATTGGESTHAITLGAVQQHKQDQ